MPRSARSPARPAVIRRRGSSTPSGAVESLEAPGLVLGIESGPAVRGAPPSVRARRRGRPLHGRRRRGAPATASCTARSGSTAARRQPRPHGAGARGGGARGLPPLGRRRPARRLRDRRRPASVNLRGGGGPLLIGHKGAGALEPENTLRSLSRAVELGCDLVEFDVLELDGRLVLGHSLPELAPDPARLRRGAGAARRLERGPRSSISSGTGTRRLRSRRSAVTGWSSACSSAAATRAACSRSPGSPRSWPRGITYPYDRHGFSQRRGLAPLTAAALVALRSRAAARGSTGCSTGQVPRPQCSTTPSSPAQSSNGHTQRAPPCSPGRWTTTADARAGARGGRRRRGHKRPSHLPADALRSTRVERQDGRRGLAIAAAVLAVAAAGVLAAVVPIGSAQSPPTTTRADDDHRRRRPTTAAETTTTAPTTTTTPKPHAEAQAEAAPAGVTIGGIHVGGLSPSAAVAVVRAAFRAPLVLQAGGAPGEVSPARARRRRVHEARVARARSAARAPPFRSASTSTAPPSAELVASLAKKYEPRADRLEALPPPPEAVHHRRASPERRSTRKARSRRSSARSARTAAPGSSSRTTTSRRRSRARTSAR